MTLRAEEARVCTCSPTVPECPACQAWQRSPAAARCLCGAPLRSQQRGQGLCASCKDRQPVRAFTRRGQLCRQCGQACSKQNRHGLCARCKRYRAGDTARILPDGRGLLAYFTQLGQCQRTYRREELLILGCLFRQEHGRWPAPPRPDAIRTTGDFHPAQGLPGWLVVRRQFEDYATYLAACQAYQRDPRPAAWLPRLNKDMRR